MAADAPLAYTRPWTAAITRIGHALADAASAGHLNRGLRTILTHLVIFHWNRIGLPATTQAVLAHAATEALLPSND